MTVSRSSADDGAGPPSRDSDDECAPLLSAEVLAVLASHLSLQAGLYDLWSDDNGDDEEEHPGDVLVDDADMQTVPSEAMATMLRLRSADAAVHCSNELSIQDSAGISELLATPHALAFAAMQLLGVVRLDNLLDGPLCDALLAAVNESLAVELSREAQTGEKPTREQGFGNVLARDHRWDMYMDNADQACNAALAALLQHSSAGPGPKGVLGTFFRELFQGDVNSPVHELSALVSDPFAPRQPLHPDNKYQAIAPSFTAFIALQDVSFAMGPTIVLLGTHTVDAHSRFNQADTKESFLQSCTYRASTMKRGDVMVMDSRLLHCASANKSETRRVLFYVTFENPLCLELRAGVTSVADGSLAKGIEMNLNHFQCSVGRC